MTELRVPGLDRSAEAITAFEEGFLANCPGCKLREIPVNFEGIAIHRKLSSGVTAPYRCYASEAWLEVPEFKDQSNG